MLFLQFLGCKGWLRSVLRTFAILAASVIGGCVNGVVFLISLDSTLPPSDWAYHPNPLQALQDSFAMLNALVIGTAAGIFIWPIAQVCLWRKRLVTSIPFVYAVVLLVTAGVTRLAAWGGFPVSLLAVIACLLYIRTSRWTFVRQQDAPTPRSR